jgi:two-component sensor histidine kinase
VGHRLGRDKPRKAVPSEPALTGKARRVSAKVVRVRREDASGPRSADGVSKAVVRERQLRNSLNEAETLLREVHHRVKNNLQIVASLLAMQIDAASVAVVKKALSDAAMRISTIALIHAQLCEAPSGASVDMRAFVEELVANIRRTLADSKTGVTARLVIDPVRLHLHVATHCGLLISELVTNAFQHAFAHQDEGSIEVRLTVQSRQATLSVRDNGSGMPRHVGRAGGVAMGIRLVRLLSTRQLRGRLSISRRGGTHVRVTFPVSGTQHD